MTPERTSGVGVEDAAPGEAEPESSPTVDGATPPDVVADVVTAADAPDAAAGIPEPPADPEHDAEPSTDPEREPELPEHRRGSGDDSAGEVALAILRAHYDLVRRHGAAVEWKDDPEALYELRVAIRRLRAALDLFADALPKRAAGHRDRLGEIGTVLGALRDLEVVSGRIAGWMASSPAEERDALELVGALLDERARQARRRAVVTLTSKRTRRAFDSLERLLVSRPSRSSTARTPILEIAPDLLSQEHRKLVVLGDSIGRESPAEALHSLRIRCTRLRYAVESFKPWYGKPTRLYAQRLVAIEEVLGAHHDAVVAAATLREIGTGSRRLGAAALLTLGGLAERCLQEARVARERLASRFARVSGGRWRRLVRRMEDARSSSS